MTNGQSIPDQSLFSKLSLADVWYVLSRQKWKVAIFSAVGLVAAGYFYVATPSVYQSEATLVVRYVAEEIPYELSGNGTRVLSPDSKGANIVQSEIEILRSQEVARRVVAELGLDALAPKTTGGSESSLISSIRQRLIGGRDNEKSAATPEAIAQGMCSRLMVDTPTRNSNIIKVRYQAENPDLAQRVLGHIIDAYLKRHFEIHRASRAYEFLAQQVDQTRARLEDAESKLRDLKSQLGVYSLDMAQQTITQRRETLWQQIREAESQLASAIAKRDSLLNVLTNRVAQVFPTSSVPVLSANLREQMDRLNALRKREATLLATYSENSLPLENVRAQIKELEQSIAQQMPEIPNVSLSENKTGEDDPLRINLVTLEAEIAALKARIWALRQHLAITREEEKKISETEAKIVDLQRKREMEEANYKYFYQSLEKARIDDALDSDKISNIAVVQQPTLPLRPVRPNLPRNMAIAVVLGLGTGLGLAVVFEYLVDQSLKRPRDVARVLETPVLITIPYIGRRSRLLASGTPEPTRLLPAHETGEQAAPSSRPQAVPQCGSWAFQAELSPYYEALRDRVLRSVDRANSTVCLLGVTSCTPQAGVTTVAAGLAMSLARNGDGRVLFVDATRLNHGTRGLDGLPRLAEILTDKHGRTTIMQPNLFVLSAAEVHSNIPPISPSLRIEDILQRMREERRYDLVVFDLPPVTPTSPTLRIAGLLDSVILVVEAERVPRGRARRARRLLSEAHAKVIGTVFSKTRSYLPEWLEEE